MPGISHQGAVGPGAGAHPTDRRLALGIATALTVIYSINGQTLPGNDATPSVYLAANIVQEGRTSFTPSRDPWLFKWRIRPQGAIVGPLFSMQATIGGIEAGRLYAGGLLAPEARYYLTPSVRFDSVTGERLYVGTFGPGAALSAVPVLAFLRAFAGDIRTSPELLWHGAKFAASLLAAASAAIVFLTARRWLQPGPALILAAAYGLGTSVWSTSSQTLWQHAPNEFFLALGTLFLVNARGSTRHAALAGLSFSAAVACRPTSALFSAAAAVYLLLVDRRALLAYALASIPVAAGLGAYNFHFLGSPIRFGQAEAGRTIALAKTGSAQVWQTPLWKGLAGLLASPSRGLFVFSPFLALALAGAVACWRRAEYAALRPLTVAVVVLLAVEAKHFDWWGGWSFGYRHIVDLATTLTVLIIPVAGWALATRARRALFAALLVWSVLVQALGAFAFDLDGWNRRRVYRVVFPSGESIRVDAESAAREVAMASGASFVFEEYLDVDQPQHRARLWSLRDNQIGYYLAHFAEARQAKAAGARQWLDSWRPTE